MQWVKNLKVVTDLLQLVLIMKIIFSVNIEQFFVEISNKNTLKKNCTGQLQKSFY